MSNALSLGGFRECLQTAIRMEEDQDWSPHVVDYGRFKQRLKYFARRRAQIRHMIASAQDHKLSEETLRDLCGPKQRLRVAKKLNPLAKPLGAALSIAEDEEVEMPPPPPPPKKPVKRKK